MVMDTNDITQITFFSYFTNGTQRCENDESGRPVYIGYAEPGSSTGELRWQIRKITYDVNGAMETVIFANGTNLFDKEWDERSSYDYTE